MFLMVEKTALTKLLNWLRRHSLTSSSSRRRRHVKDGLEMKQYANLMLQLINKYFDEISQDSGKVCYGVEDTLKALELGAAETLIVFENLEITRWTLKSSEGSEI